MLCENSKLPMNYKESIPVESDGAKENPVPTPQLGAGLSTSQKAAQPSKAIP